mgnify:CR=1 FL=1
MPAYLTRIGNLTLGSRFDGRLHIGGGIIDRLVIRQCSVGIVLDGLRNRRVERGNRARCRVLQGLLERRQVWELLL